MSSEEDSVNTVTDGDEAPRVAKNARKKRKRKGISGSDLPEFNPNDAANNDVEPPPRVSKEAPEPDEKDENGKPRGKGPRKRTLKDSKFFGVKPTTTEVETALELLTMAQAMFTQIPPAIIVGFKDGQPIMKECIVANFKTSVFEMNEKNEVRKIECTYAYKFAKISAIMSNGVVGKLENFCEDHPFVSSIALAGVTVFSFSRELQKLEAMLKANAAPPPTQNPETPQDPAQYPPPENPNPNIPIDNDGEPIKVNRA